MPKRIEPKRPGRAAELPTDTLTLVVMRNGVLDEHDFTVQPRVHFGDIAGVLDATARRGATEADQLRAVPYMLRILRRCMIDSDGTPEKWKPNIVDGHFTSPDGKHLPVHELPIVQAFDAGSSRRRWVKLLLEDDDVEIEEGQIVEAMEYVVELASSPGAPASDDVRPTSRSSSS